MKKEEKFERNLIENSNSETYAEAKEEWRFQAIRYSANSENVVCICGQQHLKQLIYIQNLRNAKSLIIGSNCAIQFFGILEQKTIFPDIARLNKDIEKTVSTKSLKWLLGRNAISNSLFNQIKYINYKSIFDRTEIEKKTLNCFNLDFIFYFTKEDFAFDLKKYLNINEALKSKFGELKKSKVNGRDKDFIESLNDFFSENGYLTEKQLFYFNSIYKKNIAA